MINLIPEKIMIFILFLIPFIVETIFISTKLIVLSICFQQIFS